MPTPPDQAALTISRFVFTLWAISLPIAIAGFLGFTYYGAGMALDDALLFGLIASVIVLPFSALVALLPTVLAKGLYRIASSNKAEH